MDEKRICTNCKITELIEKATKPKTSQLHQPYYYRAYYWCTKCHKLYHDEKFKVVNTSFGFTDLHQKKEDISISDNHTSDLEIWTDGACVFNGQPNARAAWAFVSGQIESAGLVTGEKQTNNVAEALAIYHALLWAVEQGAKNIKVHSDSQITLHNLKKTPLAVKANQEIFHQIAQVITKNQLHVTYVKVAGHADDENNNRADRLANGLAAGK